jgi:hypothetical protein
VSVPVALGVTVLEPFAISIPENASLALVSVPVLLAVHTSPVLIVHDSVAALPCITEVGETPITGGGGAVTVSVTTSGVVGGGQVSVYVKEPADAGFTVVVPLVAAGPVRVKAGSVLLHVQPLLPFVFHDSVAPLPWTTDADERPELQATVGCCTTVKGTAGVVVAGTVHASVYV